MSRKKTPERGNGGALTLAENAETFAQALRRWFLRERRDLPWRRERSVYRTLVSEFMLLQTQVSAVVPYFENWMRRWKNFDELARADEADVLRAWEGLGYYSRAKNLHAAARRIAAENRVPATAQEWRALRGVGAYTAAAVASIAQGVPVAVVDGNVVRILARLSGDARVFRDGASAAAAFSPLAEALLDRAFPGDHNEAMMELGALVCSRRSPRCLCCPVAEFCAARFRGVEEDLPKFRTRKIRKVEVVRILCRVGGEIVLTRNTAGTRRLKNLCEFPRAEDFDVPADELLHGATLVFEGRRGIADEAITERFFLVPAQRAEALEKSFRAEHAEIFRAGTDALAALTFSGPHRKWLGKLLEVSA